MLTGELKKNCFSDSQHLGESYLKFYKQSNEFTRRSESVTLSSSFLSFPVHSHYLYGHMLAAFWEWYAKSGEEKSWVLVAHPHLPPFTSHLSFGHVQYRGQLWPLNSESADRAALAAVKETHPCLTQFTPVTPVALLLWCCAPALLVSDVGVLVLVLIRQHDQVQTRLPVSLCEGVLTWIWEWWILV